MRHALWARERFIELEALSQNISISECAYIWERCSREKTFSLIFLVETQRAFLLFLFYERGSHERDFYIFIREIFLSFIAVFSQRYYWWDICRVHFYFIFFSRDAYECRESHLRFPLLRVCKSFLASRAGERVREICERGFAVTFHWFSSLLPERISGVSRVKHEFQHLIWERE